MKARQTRQLAAVYEIVRTARDHPSAEVVHARVRRKLPNVSLGTVYRNLQKLAAQGQVRLVQLAERATRYDGVLAEHDHFCCDRCGAVTDWRRKLPPPQTAPLRRAGFTVHSHTLTFYGLCPNCTGALSRRAGRVPRQGRAARASLRLRVCEPIGPRTPTRKRAQTLRRTTRVRATTCTRDQGRPPCFLRCHAAPS